MRTVSVLLGALVLAAGTVCIVAASAASAASAAMSAVTTPTLPAVTYNHSCDRTAQTQTAMNQCAAKEVRELRHQLAAALSRQEKGGSPSSVRLIQSAQSSFVAYEKAECAAVAAPNLGGSIYPLIFGSCEVRLTVQRIEEVREDLSGFLGK
jgi:uncharacterized protein YecT (DUF1311 family)